MNKILNQEKILTGFKSPVFDSQATFRSLLRANSFPGRIEEVSVQLEAPVKMDRATAAVCLTLLDYDVKPWLDAEIATTETLSFLNFHCGCPISQSPDQADFALIADLAALEDLSVFNIGSSELPDRSATLIIQTSSISNDADALTLTGPGIKKIQNLKIADVTSTFWQQRREMADFFPQGLDLIFVSDRQICAIPRSTIVED